MIHVRQAGPADVADLAALLWLDTYGSEPTSEEREGFAADLATWWRDQPGHQALLAEVAPSRPVGMAWLGLQPRVPRPGAGVRLGADVQSVFVRPEHRGNGTGTALVEAAGRLATDLGADRVTVLSGRRAKPLYERLGFASSPLLLRRS